MCSQDCKLSKILGIVVLFVVGVSILLFSMISCKKCRGIKGKAHKVFDDMGELIGEFNFIKKQ